MRRNKEWKKGKEGRPAFGKKGQWVTRQTLDLSCIIEPVDHPPRPRSAREREAEEEEEDSQMAVAGRKRGALPPRRRGGLYLSGARTVTRDSHLLPEFHITAILNAADNVAYKSVAGPFTRSLPDDDECRISDGRRYRHQDCRIVDSTACRCATTTPMLASPSAMCCVRSNSSTRSSSAGTSWSTVAAESTGTLP